MFLMPVLDRSEPVFEVGNRQHFDKAPRLELIERSPRISTSGQAWPEGGLRTLP